LQWREDSTNNDERYLRNYIRHRLLPRLDSQARIRLLSLIRCTDVINQEIDHRVEAWLDAQATASGLNRRWFVQLPHAVSREVVASWLRRNGVHSFDTKTLERLVIACKIQRPGTLVDAVNGISIRAGGETLALIMSER
jgi:tRNA(Ile)-lysidine synthase TilS/MesJ